MEEYFRLVVFLAVMGTVVMTGITTLAAVMYNLIADVVGGVEVVVLEETFNVPVADVPARFLKADRPAAPAPQPRGDLGKTRVDRRPKPTGWRRLTSR